METFDFPYHTTRHVYPKGDSFKFGRGYEFSAAPQLPVQRRFVLSFPTIQWFLDAAGTADASIEPQINALALDEFYRRHYTWKTFIYPHPVFGEIKVKFAADAPFEMPKSLPGGTGATDEFELTLVEQG
jgi:hypothetical protein